MWWVISGCVATLVAASAAANPVGIQFQVNTYRPSVFPFPRLASTGDEGFVVVWSSWGKGTDIDENVHAQRYSSGGVRLGPEFQVNSHTTSAQEYPSVAAIGSDSFMIVWRSQHLGGPDPQTREQQRNATIQGQIFTSDGAPRGREFRISGPDSPAPKYPEVAPDGDGGFVVVWISSNNNWGDPPDHRLEGRLFSSTGMPRGPGFRIGDVYRYFDVAPDGSGGFVVVWESEPGTGTDTSSTGIRGRRFSSAGLPLGGEFQVNTYTPGAQFVSAVASDGSDGFVVVWVTAFPIAGVTSQLRARRFSSTGQPRGSEFQVSSSAAAAEYKADVAPDGAGGFVVVWQEKASGGPDRSIEGRLFSHSGAPLGDDFQVSTYATGFPQLPAVASTQDGFVVVWHGLYGRGTGPASGIRGRRFRPSPIERAASTPE